MLRKTETGIPGAAIARKLLRISAWMYMSFNIVMQAQAQSPVQAHPAGQGDSASLPSLAIGPVAGGGAENVQREDRTVEALPEHVAPVLSLIPEAAVVLIGKVDDKATPPMPPLPSPVAPRSSLLPGAPFNSPLILE